MSANKFNPATINSRIHVNGQWELIYESAKQASKGKKPKKRTTKAGAIQSISHTSKGVVDGASGHVLIFITTARQRDEDLPLGFQCTLMDMDRCPSDLRQTLLKGRTAATHTQIAREF